MIHPNEVTVEESKRKTAELLPEGTDLSYITEEFLRADVLEVESDKSIDTWVFYGWNMAYGHRNGHPTYEVYGGYERDPNRACANSTRVFAYHYDTDHDGINMTCRGTELLRFTVNNNNG